jgi:hypothetical protein
LQNYPNPFNPATRIRFTLPVRSFVRMSVYSVVGAEVATLVDEQLAAGVYEREWVADHLTTGAYFGRLAAVPTTPDVTTGPASVIKMLLIR